MHWRHSRHVSSAKCWTSQVMNTLKNLTGYVRPPQCPTDSASAGSSIFHTVLMVRTHYTTNHFTTLISQLSDLRRNAHFHKVCPAPYQQLFTICSIYHDGNEGYADSMDSRLIPRLYCLLSGKSQLIYETLVQLIIEKAAHWNFDISWQKSVSDFEQSDCEVSRSYQKGLPFSILSSAFQENPA
jgi:hypothetical protein